MKKSKKYIKLERKYKKALSLLSETCEWCGNMFSGDSMEQDSPTMYYVCKEAEKLT